MGMLEERREITRSDDGPGPIASELSVHEIICADRELIAVCREFEACELSVKRIFAETADDWAAVRAAEAFWSRSEQQLDRMDQLTATTTSGLLARARALALYGVELTDPNEVGRDPVSARMLRGLLRDALTVNGLSVPRPWQDTDARFPRE